MSEINPVAISEQFDTYKDVKDDPYGAWAAIQALATALPSAAVAEREPVAQFRKVGCSDWYDGLPDHQDGRGPYEERTLYLDPLPTSELEAENARLRDLVAKMDKALEPFADIADLIDSETEGMSETDELALHFHDYLMAAWPVALFLAARRVREGGKVDG